MGEPKFEINIKDQYTVTNNNGVGADERPAAPTTALVITSIPVTLNGHSCETLQEIVNNADLSPPVSGKIVIDMDHTFEETALNIPNNVKLYAGDGRTVRIRIHDFAKARYDYADINPINSGSSIGTTAAGDSIYRYDGSDWTKTTHFPGVDYLAMDNNNSHTALINDAGNIKYVEEDIVKISGIEAYNPSLTNPKIRKVKDSAGDDALICINHTDDDKVIYFNSGDGGLTWSIYNILSIHSGTLSGLEGWEVGCYDDTATNNGETLKQALTVNGYLVDIGLGWEHPNSESDFDFRSNYVKYMGERTRVLKLLEQPGGVDISVPLMLENLINFVDALRFYPFGDDGMPFIIDKTDPNTIEIKNTATLSLDFTSMTATAPADHEFPIGYLKGAWLELSGKHYYISENDSDTLYLENREGMTNPADGDYSCKVLWYYVKTADKIEYLNAVWHEDNQQGKLPALQLYTVEGKEV